MSITGATIQLVSGGSEPMCGPGDPPCHPHGPCVPNDCGPGRGAPEDDFDWEYEKE